MDLFRAAHSGFCFGVRRAIDTAFTRAEQRGPGVRIVTCGPLIHNRNVAKRLHECGIGMIEHLAEARPGDVVFVRSHGEPKEFYDEAEARGIELVDTTCVFVEKIHHIVRDAHAEGRPVIIVGSSSHPEVTATNGWCDYEALIIGSAEEAKAAVDRGAILPTGGPEPLIVCQTTFKAETLEEILEVLRRAEIPFTLRNTICNATRDRQQACRDLSQQVDLMVVIGDRNSSNSVKLYEIAQKNCKNAKFIEDISDLQLKELQKYTKIGVTAGASTPEWIIKEVIASMSENVTTNTMMDFMDDIEKSLRLPRTGEIIDGKVHQVTENEVIVNMGCKKDGILPKEEVTLEPGQKLTDLFKEGDEIQAKVLKTDDSDGGILLSKKKLEINENYKELQEAMENKETLSVKLIRAVNGGVIAAYKEVTGFVPMSQLSDKYVEKADEFLGQTVDIKVIKVDSKRNRAVFSRKAVLVDDRRKQVAEIWANLNVGDIVEGKVMRFTDYGAFVDIGGLDGLLHISEISWGKLKNPQEVLSIGDIINVKILSLNEEKGKISLGLKQTQPEPWTLVGTKYQVGQIISGKVVQIKEYGAFVELEAGLDGLVHIS